MFMPFFLIACLIQAQTPTLEETLAWLHEALPVKAKHEGSIENLRNVERVTAADFEQCAAKIGLETESTDPQSRYQITVAYKYEFQFSLQLIDAGRIELAPKVAETELLALHLQTKKDEKAIKTKRIKRLTSSAPSFAEGQLADIWLPMPDRETGQRFQKAFAHAATLCQAAKKEPF